MSPSDTIPTSETWLDAASNPEEFQEMISSLIKTFTLSELTEKAKEQRLGESTGDEFDEWLETGSALISRSDAENHSKWLEGIAQIDDKETKMWALAALTITEMAVGYMTDPGRVVLQKAMRQLEQAAGVRSTRSGYGQYVAGKSASRLSKDSWGESSFLADDERAKGRAKLLKEADKMIIRDLARVIALATERDKKGISLIGDGGMK